MLTQLCSWRRLGIAVVAGTAGVTLNLVPTFGFEHLWPGRVVTLPVAVFLGPWCGLVAGGIGAASTWAAHPILFALFTLEAGLLGVGSRRGATVAVRVLTGVLTASVLLLWPASVGIPDSGWAALRLLPERLMALLLAPVTADLIGVLLVAFGVRPAWATPVRSPLRRSIFQAFVLASTLPVLLIGAVGTAVFGRQAHAATTSRVADVAASLADRINSHVDGHVAAVMTFAAATAALPSPGDASSLMLRYRAAYPAFRGIAVADASGRVEAIEPAALMRRGLSIADQPFFRDVVDDGKAAISDVRSSPVTGEPIVFLGAPIPGAGTSISGVAHASMSLAVFESLVDSYVNLPGASVVLVDRGHRVIFASRAVPYRAGADMTDSPLIRAAGHTGAPTFSYGAGAGTSSRIVARALVPTTGWGVFIEQPESLAWSSVPTYQIITIGLVGLAGLTSILAARRFAHVVTAPLERLVATVREFSPDGSSLPPPPPVDAPLEIATLAADIGDMQRRLRLSYARVRAALTEREGANRALSTLAAKLELTIDRRTAELWQTTSFLRHVLATLPGAIFVVDEHDRVTLTNEMAATITGYSTDELKELTLDALLAEADASDGLCQEADRHAERSLLTRGGTRVPVLVSSAVLGRDGTAIQGQIHVALDIRDRRRLELELRQAQKLESVGRLAAGVAHEINTPVQFVNDSVHFVRDAFRDIVQVIQAYDQVARQAQDGRPIDAAAVAAKQAATEADLDYLMENVPKALERSIDGLGRVATIVRSMREFAHPDGTEMTSLDLNRAIESTLVIARNEYKYVADVATELGDLPPVLCYAGELNQALLNIVVNAAQAIGEVVDGTAERGRITIITQRDGNDAIVAISDTGGGIPDAVRDRIFDPFFTTKPVGKGTGQGLAIARAVVHEKHGGTLTVESQPGHGTTFTIRIPIAGRRGTSGLAA